VRHKLSFNIHNFVHCSRSTYGLISDYQRVINEILGFRLLGIMMTGKQEKTSRNAT
jgi:hypothetical protein